MNFVYQKNSGKVVGLSFEDAIITMNIQAEVLFWSQKLAFVFFFHGQLQLVPAGNLT